MNKRPYRGTTAALLVGYLAIGLAANFCFREGGTDTAHRLAYFVGGNLLGITSTALLMGVYARMNVNLAMVLATSGSFVLVQGAFRLAYHTQLTAMQVAGILMVGAGTALATMSPEKRRTEPAVIPEPDGAATEGET